MAWNLGSGFRVLESESQPCVQPNHVQHSSMLGEYAHEIRLAIHARDTDWARLLLLEAKPLVPDGEWHRWVEEWICITPRRAQQIMRESAP